jgi:hypothetical protein
VVVLLWLDYLGVLAAVAVKHLAPPFQVGLEQRVRVTPVGVLRLPTQILVAAADQAPLEVTAQQRLAALAVLAVLPP